MINCFLQLHSEVLVSSLIFFLLFTTGVIDTGGKLTTRWRWYWWQFSTGVVDTGGKFAAGINNTGKIYYWCR
jgi:hypothetical protein